MKEISFATGNALKLRLAADAARSFDIKVNQKTLKIDEIQSESAELVACDKAAKAFSILNEPVIISDDSWAFLGLGGFPGVYMHSINEWFKPKDFLRLMDGVKNRQVVLTQMIVYQDADSQKLFKKEIDGQVLNEVRGISKNSPNHTVISMDGDDGLSIAEVYMTKSLNNRRASQIWQEFFKWYSHL